MYFSQLAAYFEQIEGTRSRVEITKILAELFNKLSAEEIGQTVYLLQGRVAPLFEKTEFGMAEKTVIKSIVSSLNIDRPYFEKENHRLGDVGKTVEEFKKQYVSFEEREMSINEVFLDLERLAKASGDGSNEMKVGILSGLVRQLDSKSCRYLVRIPQGMMRLGFSDMTIIDAYSWMLVGSKQYRPEIEGAYHVRPDLGYIGRLIKEKGIEGIKKVTPEIFTPIIMMRAERLSSGEEIVKQIGTCAVEPKYDGFRLQIHYKKKTGEVRLYSRNLEDVSFMYPDVVMGVQQEINAEDIIFEGEALGYNPQTHTFLPFQETVQRKRKYDIEEKAKEIPLKLFVFELLYCNGVSHINDSFTKRREILEKVISKKNIPEKNTTILAPHELLSDASIIEKNFDDAVAGGLEGIIAKKLDGTYKPGARGWNWIKFKRSYSSKIHDTVDCLVMGYDVGKGKRTGFGIGAFLVGVYDEKEETFKTVSKIGTGLTDDEWREMKTRCDKLQTKKKPLEYTIDKTMEVDMWVIPGIVVEIKADEITQSPSHTALYALRFPRLVRFRDDKSKTDVTTFSEISGLYTTQEA
ncbi:MAG: ATP-dependent DNA ligase [Candidatus Roizmanbacteria bacterium]|nr:ATP-dependent DNA ligase [Candidatus Roizmanbacteria bacterium]